MAVEKRKCSNESPLSSCSQQAKYKHMCTSKQVKLDLLTWLSAEWKVVSEVHFPGLEHDFEANVSHTKCYRVLDIQRIHVLVTYRFSNSQSHLTVKVIPFKGARWKETIQDFLHRCFLKRLISKSAFANLLDFRSIAYGENEAVAPLLICLNRFQWVEIRNRVWKKKKKRFHAAQVIKSVTLFTIC